MESTTRLKSRLRGIVLGADDAGTVTPSKARDIRGVAAVENKMPLLSAVAVCAVYCFSSDLARKLLSMHG